MGGNNKSGRTKLWRSSVLLEPGVRSGCRQEEIVCTLLSLAVSSPLGVAKNILSPNVQYYELLQIKVNMNQNAYSWITAPVLTLTLSTNILFSGLGKFGYFTSSMINTKTDLLFDPWHLQGPTFFHSVSDPLHSSYITPPFGCKNRCFESFFTQNPAALRSWSSSNLQFQNEHFSLDKYSELLTYKTVFIYSIFLPRDRDTPEIHIYHHNLHFIP